MNKSLTYNIAHFSFYLQVLMGIIINFIDQPQYSFPPNMGWIIITGLLCLIYRDMENK
jgi:hypothetical protein